MLLLHQKMTDAKKIKQKKFTQTEVDDMMEEAAEIIGGVEIENDKLKKTIAKHEATIAKIRSNYAELKEAYFTIASHSVI